MQGIRSRLSCLLLCVTATPAFAHGFAGKRFFPATLSVDDSFVAPELDFLGATSHQRDGSEDVNVSSFSAEFAKPVKRNFQLSVGAAYLDVKPNGAASERGFDNLSFGGKYQVFIHDKAEAAFAVGFDADVGGTGSRHVGAESFSTISPAIYYSKGLGGVKGPRARPFAVTAQAAVAFPTNSTEPHMLNWGMTLQYSLPYLEDFVKNTGLGAPWRKLIPVLELPMQSCLDRGCAGHTTGTVDPGVVWIGKVSQVGFELTLPINRDSGSGTGFLLQYHLYLDDIFPSWATR